MKSIPNRTFATPGNPAGETTTTVKLLTTCLDTMPPGGFTFSVMKARKRVADALDKVPPGEGQMIELEDADYATAAKCAEETKWGNRGNHLIDFGAQFGF